MTMASALRKVEGGETLSLDMAELYTELKERWGEKKLDDKMTRRLDEFAVRALASAMRSGPLPPDMLKLQSELETVYTKQGLADKVKSIQDGWGTMREKKAKQGAQKVHQRNVNELGMEKAQSGESVTQKCPNCRTEKKTTHVFFDNGVRKIVLDQCRSRRLTPQCDHTMQVLPNNKKPPPTISRRVVIIRSKAAAVESSSDEPSSHQLVLFLWSMTQQVMLVLFQLLSLKAPRESSEPSCNRKLSNFQTTVVLI